MNTILPRLDGAKAQLTLHDPQLQETIMAARNSKVRLELWAYVTEMETDRHGALLVELVSAGPFQIGGA